MFRVNGQHRNFLHLIKRGLEKISAINDEWVDIPVRGGGSFYDHIFLVWFIGQLIVYLRFAS